MSTASPVNKVYFPPSEIREASEDLRDLSVSSFQPLARLTYRCSGRFLAVKNYFQVALGILSGGSYQNIQTHAKTYLKKLGDVREVLDGDTSDLLPTTKAIKSFVDTYDFFSNAYLDAYSLNFPDDRVTILNLHKKKLSLMMSSFMKELSQLPKEQRLSWGKAIEDQSDEMSAIFPRLAIHELVSNATNHFPEYKDTLAPLQEKHFKLDFDQVQKLKRRLRNEINNLDDEPDLNSVFKGIEACSYQLQNADKKVFNGILKIVYEETDKYCKIYEEIPFDQIQEIKRKDWMEASSKAIFLSLLRQNKSILPISIQKQEGRSSLGVAYKSYQNLSLLQKSEFDRYFIQDEKKVCQDDTLSKIVDNWQTFNRHLDSDYGTIYALIGPSQFKKLSQGHYKGYVVFPPNCY